MDIEEMVAESARICLQVKSIANKVIRDVEHVAREGTSALVGYFSEREVEKAIARTISVMRAINREGQAKTRVLLKRQEELVRMAKALEGGQHDSQ